MRDYLRHFKTALIATGVTFLVTTVLVLFLAGSLTGRRSPEQAAQMGTGLGVLAALVLAPFWISAVLKQGQERRERLRPNVPKKAKGARNRQRK